MGKPGAQAMNIFQTQGIKNNPEKGRYSDPQIEGLGSPYNKRSCGSNYKQVIKNPLGRGINTLNSQNNQKSMGKQKDCGCPKDLESCNCE
jgi:hypothetical protein